MREARIAARLQHRNAIALFDVAEHEGDPFLVMEFLPSKSLSAVLEERGTLTPAEAAEIGAQVADGARRGARGRHRAPRRQARQHPARRQRHGEDHRLRHLPGHRRRHGDHADRHARRHPGLPRPGDRPRRRVDPRLRRVLPRLDALPRDRGQAAVRHEHQPAGAAARGRVRQRAAATQRGRARADADEPDAGRPDRAADHEGGGRVALAAAATRRCRCQPPRPAKAATPPQPGARRAKSPPTPPQPIAGAAHRRVPRSRRRRARPARRRRTW